MPCERSGFTFPILVRTVLIYLILVLSIRLTGKRQVGEMQLSELITAFLISEVAAAPLSEIEDIIRPCGLYRMKAENIRDASIMMLERFGGELPKDMDGLLLLSGVGRKIANLLLGTLYNHHLQDVISQVLSL